MKEITIDSALNDTFSLPAPILKGLLEKAVNVWNDEDKAAYEEMMRKAEEQRKKEEAEE